MSAIQIQGLRPLKGTVGIQGSKNAVLPMMAASLLADGVTVIRHVPEIEDVFSMMGILESLGCKCSLEKGVLTVDTKASSGHRIPEEYVGKMRSSCLLLGPLLAERGEAVTYYPGGCVIGKRPIDLHLYALKRLGASFFEAGGMILARADRLRGARIRFSYPSVGATENAILAAVTAEGETEIENCAREPEIVWLCRFLNAMGAKIEGAGEDCICIEGTEKLCGTKMQIPADRIVTGTYLCAAAATRGHIVIENAPEGELDAFLQVYRKMGGQYEWKSGKLIANGAGIQFSVPFLETEAYPGFPTDLQSPLLAVLTTVPGISRIRENIFENRFKICSELTKMGAHIEVRGSEVKICGSRLKGCRLRAEELRGGAALVIAALAADGESVIEGVPFIRRGYEDICRDLRYLQAEIYMEDILSV